MSVRLGIVGLGGIAQRAYLPVLTAMDSVEVAAVMSRQRETVDRICRTYRLPKGATELNEFLQASLDAAVVLTPSPTHYDITRALLDARLDVLVEKPATLSARETAALGELAGKRGRFLMVAFNRRYSPLYRQAKDLFAGKQVALVIAEKHRATAAHSSLESNFVDDTIHVIDLLRWYGGEGHAVSTQSRMRDGKLMNATSVVAFEGGGFGIVATSLEAGGWQERVTLHGDRFSVQVDAFRELRVIREESEQVFGRETAGQWTTALSIRGFTPMLQHFVECIKTRRAPETNAQEAFRTQVLVEEMVARNGAPPRGTK